jgi:hypothetical protein
MSIADLHACIEANDPSIKSMEVLYVLEDDEPMAEINVA